MVEQLIKNMAEVTLAELPWLELLYTGVTTISTHEGLQPVSHIHYNEYESVLPDDKYKAYGFIELEDPITFTPGRNKRYVFNCSMTIWLDTLEVLDRSQEDTPDTARQAILDALESHKHKTTTIEVLRMFEKFDSIFGRYKVQPEHTQFMMRPYYAVKVNMKVTQREIPCI